MKESPFRFTVGQGAWAEEIRYYTTEINLDYWADFRPVTNEDIKEIERTVNRRLPEDFNEFLRVFGHGRFPAPFHGNIYAPQDFASIGHGQLPLILGSSKWASEEDHHRFYATHGAFNPAPKKFTNEALLFEGVNLLDLLQIGGNGLCCYHHIYVGGKPTFNCHQLSVS